VAQLKNDPACDGFVTISLYDQKPVYLLSNWLNIIDTYNHNMNNIDIADQLRTIYCFFMWLRKRIWWWAMFFWCFEMLLNYAYVSYRKFQLLHNRKPMSHYEFHRKVALAWIKSEVYWPKKRRDSRLSVPSNMDEDSLRYSRARRYFYVFVIPEINAVPG